MEAEKKIFNFKSIDIQESGEFEVFPNTVELLFVNNGDTNARVNDFLLKRYPVGFPDLSGASVSITCNEGEFFGGFLKVVFIPPIGTDLFVSIIQRYMIKAIR